MVYEFGIVLGRRYLMLEDELEIARRLVKTEAYQMSVGEIASMYRDREVIINPDFQRVFRWNSGQKSRFIESILLGIPVPSIFVYEREDSKWEIIDGLQRTSTILEFMGLLRDPDSEELLPPSCCEATKYLPSLYNAVWEVSDKIHDVPVESQIPLKKPQQLDIRRARIGVEILKRPSDNRTKYDLFQRLNSGGVPANPQEVRNCIIIMVNPQYFDFIKRAAEYEKFIEILSASSDQITRQRHIEFATRFFVHTYIPYDGKLDVEEYIDDGIIKLAEKGVDVEAWQTFTKTFDILYAAFGDKALKRLEGGKHVGRVGRAAFECLAIGLARNIEVVFRRPDPVEFVRERIDYFWTLPSISNFLSPGLRGTVRIQRTISFGDELFSS